MESNQIMDGNVKSEIGELVAFYFFRLGVSYNSKLGKGAIGKRLNDLLSVESPVNPNDLINPELLGIRKLDGSANIPPRYEDEFLIDWNLPKMTDIRAANGSLTVGINLP